jgi:hypothetical protein
MRLIVCYSVPYSQETIHIEELLRVIKHYKKESPNTYDDIYKLIYNIF